MTRAAMILPLLFAVACSGEEVPEVSGADLLDNGPYAVGYQRASVTYRPAGADSDRTLPLEIWYPAAAPGAQLTYRLLGIANVDANLATDAPALMEGEARPLVVYSHGNGGFGLVAHPYGEHLASHGFVVVAPDHVGNTAADYAAGSADSFVQSAVERPQDISAVLDHLESEDAGFLAGRTDVNNVTMIGHSFGGYTALAIAGAAPDPDGALGCPSAGNTDCEYLAQPDVAAAVAGGFRDPRVVAIVPQAPALVAISAEEVAGIDIPILLQSGRNDQTTTASTSAEPAWAARDGVDDLWIDVIAGGHYTFISICEDLGEAVIREFLPSALMDGCGADFIVPSEAIPVLSAYALGFARLHSLGETQWSPVLRGMELGGSVALTLP